MELIDYVRMVGRHWIWVVLFTVLGLVAGVAWITLAPKTYSASTDLFVGSVAPVAPQPSAVEAEAASAYVLNRMPSYAALISSSDIADSVIAQLRLDSTADEFTRSVTASVPTKTVLLRVSAQGDSAATAASTANATAVALGAKIERLEAAGQAGVSPVATDVVRFATPPAEPSSPNKRLSLALGLLAGLGIGLVAASLRDQSIRRPLRRGRRRAPTSTMPEEYPSAAQGPTPAPHGGPPSVYSLPGQPPG